jgi:hypothetical protein
MTETVLGTKAVIHGLAMDSIGRSNCTHLIPHYVRQALLHFNAGEIPLYSSDYTLDADGHPVFADSVASRLYVDVKDAESYETDPDNSAFKEYSDVPLSEWTRDRFSFFKYNSLATELDQHLMLESQIYALDNLSQLVSESFTYHFQYLLALDMEYHRLRDDGPLGEFNESQYKESWYNLYTMHRQHIKEAYLDTNLVTLPHGLANANWKIRDVLREILHMWSPDGANLRDDVVLSIKGLVKGKTGASLGLYPSGAGYEDADGNPRFITPAYRRNFTVTSAVNSGLTTGGTITTTGDTAHITPGTSTSESEETVTVAQVVSHAEWKTELEFVTNLIRLKETAGSGAVLGLPTALYNEAEAGHGAGFGLSPNVSGEYWFDSDYFTIKRLPGTNGASHPDEGSRPISHPNVAAFDATTKETDPTDAAYSTHTAEDYRAGKFDLASLTNQNSTLRTMVWRGYMINLVDLLELTRKFGRAMEPEALDLASMLGISGTIEQLMTTSTGLKPTTHDDLLNLYEANYSFNENPARVYTAAHLGPANMILDPDASNAINLEGNVLSTKSKKGALLTARQRYWTPVVPTSSEAQTIVDRFMPGTSLGGTLLNDVALGSTGKGIKIVSEGLVSPQLVAALLSTDLSMLTKVEKNVVLPASVPAPEAAFCSGIGLGAVQLISEMLMDAVGSKTYFGLGHNGFNDIRLTDDGSAILTRGEAAPLTHGTALNYGELFRSSTWTTPATYSQQMPTNVLLGEAAKYVDADLDLQGDTLALTNVEAKLDGVKSSWCSAMLPRDEMVAANSDKAGVTASDVAAAVALAPSDGSDFVLNTRIHHSQFDHHLLWGSLKIDDDLAEADPLITDSAAMAVDCPGGTQLMYVPSKVSVELNDGTLFTTSFGAKDSAGQALGTNQKMTPSIIGSNEIYSGMTNYLQSGLERLAMIRADGKLDVSPSHGYFRSSGGVAGDVWFKHYAGTPLDVMIQAINQAIVQEEQNGTAGGADKAPKLRLSEFGGLFATVTIGLEMIAADANASNAYSECVGHVENVYEVHFASDSGADDSRSQLMSEARTRFQNINAVEGADFKVQATFTPAMGNPYSIEMSNVITSVAAARLQTAGAFVPQGGASKPMGAWSIKPILGIQPPVEEGGFTEWIASIMSTDPTQQGIKATGTYTDIKAMHDATNTILTSTESEFRPGRFNDEGEYSSGTSQILETSSGTPVPALYGGNWIYFGGTSASGPTHIYENKLWGYDLGTDGLSRNIFFSRAVSGRFGNVNSGAIYTSTGAQFSFSGLLSRVGTSATYQIPDKPENRMRYRPGRNLVDAAIAAEQKMLLAPIHERLDMDGGVIGLPYHGPKTPFRFHTLVEAGMANQYILERATSKTRMTDPSQRNRLVFTKIALIDPNSERLLMPDMIRVMDAEKTGRKESLFSSPVAQTVLDREMIRAIQRGRQQQRISKS